MKTISSIDGKISGKGKSSSKKQEAMSKPKTKTGSSGTGRIPSISKKKTVSFPEKTVSEPSAIMKKTGHKRTEEAMPEEQDLLRALMDDIPDAVYFKDTKSRFVWINKAHARWFGLSDPVRAVGKSDFDFFPEELSRLYYDDEKAIMRTGQALVSKEENQTFPDGRVRWVSTTKLPLRNQNGQIIGTFGISRDITQRKRAEEDLQKVYSELEQRVEERTADLVRSEAKLRAVFAAMQDVVLVIDRAGIYRDIAPTNPDLLYRPAEDLLGKSLYEVFPQEQAEQFMTITRHALEEGQTKRIEYELPIRGRKFWFSATVTPMDNNNSVWVARDITDRKRVEGALKEERNLLRTVIDAMPDQIFVKDQQGRKIVANKADWQVSGGKTMEDILGKSDFDMYPAELAAKFWADDKIVMDTGTPVINREESTRDAQGNPVWVLTTKVPLIDSQGNIEGLVGIARNISERKRTEEALKENEARLRSIFENTTVGFYRTTPDGRILFSNPALVRMLEYDSFDELAKVNLEEYENAPEHSRQDFKERIDREGTIRGLEATWKTKKGNTIYVRENTHVIRDDKGNISYYEGTIEDITERKQAEMALRNSQQMLQTVLDTIPVRVFWKDQKSNYLGGNLPFALDAGLHSPHELLGKDDFQMAWREQAEMYRSDDRLVMETGTPKIGYEEPQTTSEGNRVWLRTSKVPLLDSEGNTVGLLGTYEDITAQKQVENRILQLNRLYAMLSQINQVIVRVPDQETLFHEICRSAVEQGGYRMAWIGLCDETDQTIKPTAFAGQEQGYLTNIRVTFNPDEETGRGPSGISVRENHCVICQDIATDPRMEPWREEGLQRGYRSAASTSFQRQGKVIGILSVYSDEVNAFTVDDKDLLTETSRDISFALDRMTMESARKLAEEKIHQQVERLTALTAIDQAISSSFDLQISLSILLFHGAKQLKADAVAVLLLNPNLNMLEYYIGRGFHTDDFEKGTVSLRDEGAGRAALNRQMVSVPDLSNHYPEFSRSKLLEAESFVAYYGVPLIAKGKIKGVLEVFHRAPLNPNREWLDFLNTLAGQAAIAVDNYQLFDGLQKSNADLRRAYDTTIEGWSHALDLRDKETEGHTQRVVEMTMKLADAAGMTEEEMVHVRRGALLHDIGKMGIPDSILLKSGELTDDEKEIMHRHPTLAFEMLSRIDYLRPALDIPYCHHEKWDGTGYPRGLIGEQIPLAARLFAIVDVWDALRSDRSYRKSWSKEKVFEHIRSLSGAYFDPHVVELFFDEFSEQT